MTHWVRNMGSKAPASETIRCMVLRGLFSLSLLAALAPLPAAEPPVGPFLFTSSTRRETDLEIQTKVRRALRKDPQLGSLNLNVHVSGGNTRLSGPVPSPQLKQRVIAIVERVEGVVTVNAAEVYVSSSAENAKPLAVRIEDDQPTQTRAASPSLPSSMPPPMAGAVGTVPFKRSERSQPTSASPQVTLLAPELAPRPIRVPEPGRLTANPRPVSPGMSLVAALEQLRQRDSRYQQIRTQIQGTTVTIHPGDAAVEDAMTFAQAVRRLPGVQHVVVAPGSR